ncbi:MAG: S8 family peptidase [Firmicutes bacterium]|nr:S8 family peptidase [Bacillota bacterium]
MDINSFNPVAHQRTDFTTVNMGAATPKDEIARKPVSDPSDLVSLSSSSRTESGKIPIIISSKEKDGLSKAKAAVRNEIKTEVKDELPIINGFTTEVDDAQFQKLLERKPDGVSIFIDEKYKMIDDPIITGTPEVTTRTDNAVVTLGVDKIWQKGFTGKDVTIAVIDTGIYPHKDFANRIIGFKDFVNGYKEPYDDQGHGTHVAGDCSGDGTMSAGRYKGTAPEAKLVGVKSLDKNGAGRFSDIIKGIQWVVQHKDEYNIKVMNMSLGGPAFQSYKEDPIAQAAQKALDAGIVPVIAAGNSGPKPGTVGSPGNNPNVLTVGAFDDKNTVTPADDEIAKFSSRGPTKIDGLTKPDILSPGVNITAATSYGSPLDTNPKIPHAGTDYITISGTSMATPIMAGIVSLVVQARPDLKPTEIIELFKGTASKMPSLDANQQGHGVVQPQAALEKALSTKPTGN